MKTPPYLVSLLGAFAIAASVAGTPALTAAARTSAIPQAAATAYTFQHIASPHDPTFTQLLGINGHGAIAGYYGAGQILGGILHPNQGFTLTLPSSYTAENFPQSMQTQVIAIDNQGNSGGFYIDHAGTTHGFLHVNGRFKTVDRPGTKFNQILGINNRGQAAGYYQDAQGHDHAYVRSSSGTFQVLPLADSQATGINDSGTVVGFTQPSDTTSAGFMVQGGTLSLLIYPGSAFTQALGENDDGQVVGFYQDSAGNTHGFIFDVTSRAYHSVEAPGVTATVINGINNAGEIVGFVVDEAQNTVGLVGMPVSNQGTGIPPAQPSATPTSTPITRASQSTSTPTATVAATQAVSTTIKLGLVLPLSGKDAAQGLAAEHGAQLAIDQANAANFVPGVTFALDAMDDTGAGGAPDGATGAAAVTSLIGDSHVAGIIGPFDTTTALLELPLANRAGITVVSPSAGDPCLTSNSAATGCVAATTELATVRPTSNLTFFRTIPTDAQQGSAMAQYLFLIKGYRRASVVDDATAYGATVAAAFSQTWKALGGNLLDHISLPEGTADYLNALTEISAEQPDVIFYGGSDPATGTPDSISVREQMLEVPSLAHTSFAGTDGIRTVPFLQAVQPAAGGLVFSTLTPADFTTVLTAASFVQQYQARFGAPGPFSGTGYDSATVLISAIKVAIGEGAQLPSAAGAPAAAQNLRTGVLAQVAATKLNGVEGALSFTVGGDLAQSAISIEQEAPVNGAATWMQVTNVPVP